MLSTILTGALLAAAAAAQTNATTTTTAAPTGTPISTPLPKPITLKLDLADARGRNRTAPHLHGLFFEDINYSGDGGLYAELIRNRALQGSTGSKNFFPDLAGWRSFGGASIALDVLNPLTDELRYALKLTVPRNASGEVGVLNEGWWDLDVKPHTYDVAFWIKAAGPNPRNSSVTSVRVSLRSDLTREVWAEKDVPFQGRVRSYNYTKLETQLAPRTAAPNSNNTFAITMDGAKAAGHSFYITLVSVFPPTFKGRKNGLRKDLAEHLYAMHPKFLRFPGGNNLEGLSIETRWQWKKTLGPLEHRPGRPGNWGYHNTDGLGYLEYLQWCEDMEMIPLLTVYSGYSLDASGANPGNTVPEEELQKYIDEAIEQIEFANGDASTKWGKVRAELGHPKPFGIKFVEIGNEDWFSDSYYWRFPRFLQALQKAYPDITYIASQAVEESPSKRNTTIPPGAMWDLHHYQTPQFFKNNFNYFDGWQELTGYKNVTIFVGEYSVLSRDRPGGVDWTNGVGRFKYPTTIAAIGEAIFALAMERNPNVVRLSSYAPLLQNFNAYQWTPNFIAFSANPNDTVLSTSYYQQQLFSRYIGTHTLPVKNTKGDFDPIWWHASIDEPQGKVYVKLVNAGPVAGDVTVELEGKKVASANGTVLSHRDEYGFNYLGNATAIVPTELPRNATALSGGRLTYKVPGFSITVLEIR